MADYTEEQKKCLLGLIAKWQVKLRLQHWRFEVEWDKPADDGADYILSVSPSPQRHTAVIRVGCFFSDEITDAERDNAVAHELVHCHTEPLWSSIEVVLNELAPQTRSSVRGILERQLEELVDAVATAFAPIPGEEVT